MIFLKRASNLIRISIGDGLWNKKYKYGLVDWFFASNNLYIVDRNGQLIFKQPIPFDLSILGITDENNIDEKLFLRKIDNLIKLKPFI